MSSTAREEAKKRVMAVFEQLMTGCGNAECRSSYCRSRTGVELSRAAALADAVAKVKAKSVVECSPPAEGKATDEPPAPSTPAPASAPKVEKGVTLADMQALVGGPEGHTPLIRRLGSAFSEVAVLEQSFARGPPSCERSALDLESVDGAYEMIAEEEDLTAVYRNAVDRLGTFLAAERTPLSGDALLYRLRMYQLLLENGDAFLDPDVHATLQALIKSLVLLLHRSPSSATETLIAWYSHYDAERLGRLVGALQMYMTVTWYSKPPVIESFRYAVEVLDILYKASDWNARDDEATDMEVETLSGDAAVEQLNRINSPEYHARGARVASPPPAFPPIGGRDGDDDEYKTPAAAAAPGKSQEEDGEGDSAVAVVKTIRGGTRSSILPYDVFYNDAINEHFHAAQDYERWVHNAPFSFCQYPFILDAASKSRILAVDAEHSMRDEMKVAMFQRGSLNPYTVFEIRRDHLVQDSLEQCYQNKARLKQPLRIKFVGEEGIDQGGVKKEFFQLAMEELFRGGFDLFSYDSETHLYWFNAQSFASVVQFELIGMLLGLAIYNSVILDVRFPRVLYKRLLFPDYKPTFDDFEEVFPELARGFRTLLAYDGDVEADYMRTFTVSYQYYGAQKEEELKEGGASTPLTADNRQEYVALCVDYFMVRSIARFYKEFENGFKAVCGGRAFKLFRPEEVELLLCGSTELDFDELRKGTRYEDGFDENSLVMQWFWDIVNTWPIEDQKRLLFFVTGSDRAPINGLKDLRFIISRNGPDSDRLPTAHTCFNHLLLPEYNTKDKLEKMLKLAIENSKGFGLM